MGPDDTHVSRAWALLFARWLLGLIFAMAGFWNWSARRRQRVSSATTLACFLALMLLPVSACGTGDGDGGQVAELPQASAETEFTGDVRVYVADRYESVRQLAPDTLETVAVLDVGLRPHGLIVSPDHRILYVTVESTNELVKVDLATHEILGRVEVSLVPNEPTITNDGRYVFIPSRGAGLCDVVDTETMQVVKQLATGGASHNAYTSADGSKVFVTSMGDDLITVIDVATLEIERQIALDGQPRPVAFTGDLSRAYVAISGLTGFITLDLIEDEIIDRLEISIPPETPVPPFDTYTHGLLLTPNERELWVAAYATNMVYGFSLPERRQFAAVPVPGGPHWLALHPDGEPLYASLESTGKVAAIHRGLREVVREADVGEGPTRIIAFRTAGS